MTFDSTLLSGILTSIATIAAVFVTYWLNKKHSKTKDITNYGGLWVGGSAYLTKNEFRFVPNLINKMFHKGDCTSIPLTEISQVNVHFDSLQKLYHYQPITELSRCAAMGQTSFEILYPMQ
ncbi:MAG: hypothetical protein R3F02_15700 [Thiolinea sp.]